MTPNSLLNKLIEKLSPNPWGYAQAAVAILVRPGENDLEFFLVKRSEFDDDPWSGDMAFPGGKKNLQDNTLIDTVIREVLEETSIDLRNKEVLGFMEPIFSERVRKTLAVQPVVYCFEDYPQVNLNYELTKYIWVPLSEIKNGKTNSMVKGWQGPVFKVRGETVWGLTYRMIEKLLDLLDED